VGSYSEPQFYGPDFISVDERAQFLEWHKEQKDQVFCNKDKLLAYCMDDANVLREACCAFRNFFLNWLRLTRLWKQ
jgi:hypothetical protein